MPNVLKASLCTGEDSHKNAITAVILLRALNLSKNWLLPPIRSTSTKARSMDSGKQRQLGFVVMTSAKNIPPSESALTQAPGRVLRGRPLIEVEPSCCKGVRANTTSARQPFICGLFSKEGSERNRAAKFKMLDKPP